MSLGSDMSFVKLSIVNKYYLEYQNMRLNFMAIYIIFRNAIICFNYF